MSKKKELENEEIVVSEKVRKTAEKRRRVKKKKKNERWYGFIFLLVMLFVGFVFWVSGEIKSGDGFSYANSNTNTNEFYNDYGVDSVEDDVIIVE